MSAVVGLHVNAEKRRLEEAKLSAESEKTTYVKVNSFGMAPWNFFCIFSFSLTSYELFLSYHRFFSFLFYSFIFVVFVFVMSFASPLSTLKNRCRV